jgi:hypothetical protein
MGSRLQKCFVNFNKSHYLYFMRFNTFFLKKGSAGFTGISKGSMAQKGLRTPVIRDCAASIIRVYVDIAYPLPAYIV